MMCCYRRLWVILLSILLVVACTQSSTSTPSTLPTPSLTGEIKFAGSTTLQPLAHELGQVFNAHYPDVILDIAAGGSRVGIRAVHNAKVDIGMASRALKPEEAEGVTQHQVAVDVLAVIVHESNPMESLTLEQLQDIYSGRIASWDEVGGEQQPITVVIRGNDSGTRGAFDEIVLHRQEPVAPDLQTAATAGDVAAMVMDNPRAIGYVGFGNLETGLRALAIDGVLPSGKTAQDGSYRLMRPLLFLTGPLSKPVAHEFIAFALSTEGQKVVEQSGWVPVK